MRDKPTIDRVSRLHPAIKDKVIEAIEAAEARFDNRVAIRVVQGLRTFEEQDALYAQGRTKPGNRVTNSKGGQSYHNYGLAIDFALLYDLDANGSYESLSWDLLKDIDKDGEADWMEVVDEFEERGFTWGGRFHSIQDNPHFEMTFGLNWRDMLKLQTAGQFITGTKYIDLSSRSSL